MKLKRAGILTKLILTAVLIYALVSLINMQRRIDEAENSRDVLAAQVREYKTENEYLEYELSHSMDDETLEDVARSKLSLVSPGEVVFYDLSD